MGYVIHAQQCDPGPRFDTKREAVAHVRTIVKKDMAACRRKFGTAVLKRYKDTVWSVQPIRQDLGPMWSLYTIHEC
jgi:hypothetical protein